MSLQETKELCSKVFIKWMLDERSDNYDARKRDDDIGDLFTSKVLLKKFDAFGIDIVIPDPLLLILFMCVEGNPGQVQIVLKDLLNHIKKVRGPIPAGYVITSIDFAFCFKDNYPIIAIPEINEKYYKLWDAQKKHDHELLESDNLCDTPEWWKEVMK